MAETSQTSRRITILEPGERLDRDLTVLDHPGGTRKVHLYLCRSKRLKEVVACKVLRPEFRIVFSALEDVLHEGEMLQTLSHPNVVEGYGVELEDHPRIIMEYLEGQTVSTAFLKGNFEAFDVEDAVSLACQVAEALTYVHEVGILHLDVKPSNVMYDDGHATLFDFSVPEYYSPDHPLKDNAGTRQYMAPEQTFRKEVGYYTDVFGLGVVFYQLLIGGDFPYPEITEEDPEDEGKTLRLLDYQKPPQHPSAINSAVPAVIGDVVLAARQADPKLRTATPEEFRVMAIKAFEKSLP